MLFGIISKPAEGRGGWGLSFVSGSQNTRPLICNCLSPEPLNTGLNCPKPLNPNPYPQTIKPKPTLKP